MQVRNLLFQRGDRTLMSGASVTIKLHNSSTLASLFQADGVTALSNPFSLDAYARATVAAPDGLYDITVTLGSQSIVAIAEQWADVVSIVGAAASSAATASAAATSASASSATAVASATSATASQAAASASQAAAAASAAAALASGQLYATTAAGITATTSTTNKYFLVISTDGTGAWYLWQNVSGTATAVTDSTGNQVGIPAARAIAMIHSVLDPLNTAVTPGDDVFWDTAFADAAGNVFGGFDLTGQFWSIFARILNLNVSTLNAGFNVIGSGTPTNVINLGPDIQIYSLDTNWDWVFVDSANNPIFGSYNGAFQYLGTGAGAGVTDGGSWAPSVAVSASQIRKLPDGRHGIRGPGTPSTTRASFDATESAAWITLGEKQKFTRMFGRQGVLPGPPMAGRPGSMQLTESDAGMSIRLRHVALYAAGNLQLTYPNWNVTDDQEGTGPILVAASIEYPAGTYFKAHFIGEAANGFVSIPPGATIATLPIGIDIPAGAIFYSNTTVIPNSGGYYPVGTGAGAAAIPGTDTCTSNSATDFTMTPQTSPNSASTYCYAPLAICGIPSDGNPSKPIVSTLGDSISQGAGGNGNPSAGLDGGIVQQACQTAGIGYLNLGNNGYQAAQIAGSLTSRRHKMEVFSSCTDVVIIVGTNDLNGGATATSLIANLQTIWAALAARGVKIWQCTIPPRTTSTDNWATIANQTPVNSGFGPEVSGGSYRQQVNTYIRTAPSPLSGVIDIASVLEVLNTSNNSYVWKANYTGDGVHPNANNGTPAAQALIPTSLFG